MAEQGCWQWLTVTQMLASPAVAADLRSFLAYMEPGQTLEEVCRKLEAFSSETRGQRLIEVAALGLVLALPLAVTGAATGVLIRGAVLLVGLAHLPPILREQRANWHCRRAAPGLAARLQWAADNIGPPWIESLPDGGRLDRRYTVSSQLPRREVCIDRWGEPVRHEWDLRVASGTLRFVCDPGEVVMTGPQGQECRFLHQGIKHAESWVMIHMRERSLQIQLDGNLSLVWWETPDPISPENCPGSDDSISLPDGVWRSNWGGANGRTRFPVNINATGFDYGDTRIDCPLPLAWLT